MLKIILILTLYFLLASTFSPCEPFGLRIYYGDVLLDLNSPEKLSIYFNTIQPCPNSFINIITKNNFIKIPCNAQKIVTSAFANYYTTYIHVCSVIDIPYEQTISYTAYGWDVQASLSPTPFKDQWIDIKLIDPRVNDRDVKLLVLADWGTINANIKIMTPISYDLKRMLREKEINGMMIAGDISYDLDSNNGTTYQQFLLMMQEISTTIPIFIAPGNHERRTIDAALLYNSSFKNYNIDKKLATGLSFGSLFLTLFDPYNIIYALQQDISSLDALNTQLQLGAQTGRFILPYSHYPLICSGQYDECFDGFTRLHDFFDAMIDNGVSLYVGAHTHSYQRNYPYFRNHSFVPLMQSPYYPLGGDFLISVVEGVAGNDRDIIPVMPGAKDFNAKYTVNQTGFAVLQSTLKYVKYSHFSTRQGFMDQFIINRPIFTQENKKYKLRIQQEQD